MFPVRESRLRSALRRSLDAAIEFATLGEYGWSPAWEGPGAPPPTSARSPEPAASGAPADATATAAADAGAPTALLVRPASAAGRSRRNAQTRGAPRCGGQPLLGRALDSQLPRTARSRDGMAPRDQRCLSRPAA